MEEKRSKERDTKARQWEVKNEKGSEAVDDMGREV